MKRRSLLLAGILSPLVGAPAFARERCNPDLSAIAVESGDSPFFEHFHQLLLPLSALENPDADIVIRTTAIDQGSYDEAAFETFIRSSRLDKAALLSHRHDVRVTGQQLKRIAAGEKDVEISIISPAGNYVHNFKITAYQAMLAHLGRRRKS